MDDFSVIPIHPKMLAELWIDYIRKDILRVAKKSKVDFQPIDVLRYLKEGKAFAALLEYGHKHVGTLILRPIIEEFTGRLILHVWILAMNQSRSGDGDLLDKVWEFVRGQAEEAGAAIVQVISDRPGWKRRLKKYGFYPTQFQAYHREVG